MRVSFNWLQEFVEIDLTPTELAERLTMAGLEVEGVEEILPSLEQVVVGRVVAVHPPVESDGLRRCQVDVGGSVVPILCGAPNIAVGSRVSVALPGARLPDGRHIQEVRIRGERSVGMICSEKELGLGEDSTGVLTLDEGRIPGTGLVEALGLHDHILEVAITPNRGDCLSHWGVAREVAAVTGATARFETEKPREGPIPIRDLTGVTVESVDLCPRYAARVIQGVHIGPSPFWLRRRLALAGLRPINNVVDATNYVLLEMGQPLHAFDHARLEEGRIVVRTAVAGERMVTLDGLERLLQPEMLVIADAGRPVALAGVMGGAATEVSELTRDLLLESAFFDSVSVRRTARALGLKTEASYRFERGVDPDGVVRALDRVARLISEVAGGRVARGAVDIRRKRRTARPVLVRVEKIHRILGTVVPQAEVGRILRRIQCRVTRRGAKALVVSPPSYRLDLTREIDFVEEVARLKGFEHIPTTQPAGRLHPAGESSSWELERQIRRLLTGWGFQEAVNFGFTQGEVLDKLRLPGGDARRSLVRIHNPLGGEAVLRSILLPSLLENLVLNESRGIYDVKLFEIARIFRLLPERDQPAEIRSAAVLAAGNWLGPWWGTRRKEVDFYDLKGILEALGWVVGTCITLKAVVDNPFLHPGRQAELAVRGEILGWIGELHPEVVRSFDLKTGGVAMEIDLDVLDRQPRTAPRYNLLPRFPAVFRDMAVVVPEGMPAAEVEAAIRRTGGALVDAVGLFDVYRGKPVPEGKKSLAFSIQYRSTERTLTDAEVAAIHGKIEQALGAELGGILR